MAWMYYVTALVAGAVGSIFYLRRRKQKKLEDRVCGRDYPKDTVVLHQFPRGPHAPSMSAFCIKLETFLRLANIPYQNIFAYKSGPKGKIPWIEYNGVTMGDSQMIINFLCKDFELDVNHRLTPEQKATSRALQKMVDEHTYWCVLMERWVFKRQSSAKTLTKLPGIVVWEIGRRTRNMAHAQGVGRHDEKEIDNLLTDDLTALSDFLGNKDFMFGKEATEVDCAIFGQLCQVKWHVPDEVKCKRTLERKLSSLNDYVERMKATFWPDWDECITHGFTKEAKKT